MSNNCSNCGTLLDEENMALAVLLVQRLSTEQMAILKRYCHAGAPIEIAAKVSGWHRSHQEGKNCSAEECLKARLGFSLLCLGLAEGMEETPHELRGLLESFDEMVQIPEVVPAS